MAVPLRLTAHRVAELRIRRVELSRAVPAGHALQRALMLAEAVAARAGQRRRAAQEVLERPLMEAGAVAAGPPITAPLETATPAAPAAAATEVLASDRHMAAVWELVTLRPLQMVSVVKELGVAQAASRLVLAVVL